jgi:hypothetical protein
VTVYEKVSLRWVRTHIPSPVEPLRAAQLAVLERWGSFGAACVASAAFETSRKHPVPRFGSGSGEARRDTVRARSPHSWGGTVTEGDFGHRPARRSQDRLEHHA